jgi:hypothetical protein
MHQRAKFRYGMVNPLAPAARLYMRRTATRMKSSLHSFSLAAFRGRHFFVGAAMTCRRSAMPLSKL